MLNLTDNELADLETIIDSRGLPKLLDAIADLCLAKSEHCATNWQDGALADLWTARADTITVAVLRISYTYVSPRWASKPNGEDTITVDLPAFQ